MVLIALCGEATGAYEPCVEVGIDAVAVLDA